MKLNLLPQPKKTEYGRGTVLLRSESVILADADEWRSSKTGMELLQKEIEQVTGLKLPVLPRLSSAGKEGREKAPAAMAAYPAALRIIYETCAGLCGEQYQIHVSEHEIVLRAGSDAGFLYASQTLRQIIRQCGALVPVLDLEDEPDLPVRGFYHDVTRGRVPTLRSLKKLADTCAFYKMNQLQLYVEHSYLFRELHGLFADRDPLTAEEIRELDAYCRTLNIELVPSLSSFGHLYELLRTRQYAHLCELEIDPGEPFSLYDRLAHHTLDVSNPESEELVRRLILEYASLFTSDKFNICSDETFDLGKGKNKAIAEKEGTTGLYMGFLAKLCKIVKEAGKTPMFWGDILQEFPQQSRSLPQDTICLYWNYEPEASDQKLKGLSEAGIQNLYICPGVHGWNHLINRYDHAYANISKMCAFAGKYHAKGLLVTDWGDYGHVNHPDFSVPGLIYGAAFSWRNELLSKEEIDRQISIIEYGDASGTLMSYVNRLSRGEEITWGQAVCKKEGRVWDQFVPEPDPERADRLRDAIRDGYAMLQTLPECSKKRFAAYLLAAQGQELLQTAWKRVNKKAEGGSDLETDADLALAEKLRLWYMDYQKLWRSVSKESELYRIGEVIFWYADRLG